MNAPWDVPFATYPMVGGPWDGMNMTGDPAVTVLPMPTFRPERQADVAQIDPGRSAIYELQGNRWVFVRFEVHA